MGLLKGSQQFCCQNTEIEVIKSVNYVNIIWDEHFLHRLRIEAGSLAILVFHSRPNEHISHVDI
jgi:hypothetical protein